MTLGPEWRPHPRRDGYLVNPERPGYMRNRRGDWFADPDGPLYWYRDSDGRVVFLDAPKEPSAAERQAGLPTENRAIARTRERMRRRIRGER